MCNRLLVKINKLHSYMCIYIRLNIEYLSEIDHSLAGVTLIDILYPCPS